LYQKKICGIKKIRRILFAEENSLWRKNVGRKRCVGGNICRIEMFKKEKNYL